MRPFKPPGQLGKWTLGKIINHGGQGTVFEATDAEAADIRAIKVVPLKSFQAKKRERFLRELRVHAELSERNASGIMPLLDHNLDALDRSTGFGYFVMPRALATLQAENIFVGRVETSLQSFLEILDGVGAAHAAGAVHRDLKPANILFLEAGFRRAAVSDFGICFLKEEARLTAVDETVGAKFFMAPEQERGGQVDVDQRADIYALGKILAFMLTGRNIYREETKIAFSPRELEGDRRLQAIHDQILLRTVCPEPTQRFDAVDDLRKTVQQILGQGGPGNPQTDPEPPSRVAPNDGTAQDAASHFQVSYRTWISQLADGSENSSVVLVDNLRAKTASYWNALEPKPATTKDAFSAARKMTIDLAEIVGFAFALGRLGSEQLVRHFRRYIEFVLRLGEDMSGLPALRGVPHVFAGLLFMSTSISSLLSENWTVLHAMLNERFEWYYESGRPIFRLGMMVPYFFHSNAIGRKANVTHDLFRDVLRELGANDLVSLNAEAFVSCYVQCQLLQCLRVAKEHEENDPRAHMWADFARFREGRVLPLLDRAFKDQHVGTKLADCFEETKETWKSGLNRRLALITEENWLGGDFFWESITSYEAG